MKARATRERGDDAAALHAELPREPSARMPTCPDNWLLVARGDARRPAAYPDHQLRHARAYPAPADQPAAAGRRRPALDRARRDPHLCRRAGDRGLLPAAPAEGASRHPRRAGALRRHLGLARSRAARPNSPISPRGSSASPSPERRRSSPRSARRIPAWPRRRAERALARTLGRGRELSPRPRARRSRTTRPMSIEDWNFEADLLDLPELRLEDGAVARRCPDRAPRRTSRRSTAIARRLEGGADRRSRPSPSEVFPDAGEDAVPALVGLISVGVLAVSADAAVFPLLPARYHLISRAPDRTGDRARCRGADDSRRRDRDRRRARRRRPAGLRALSSAATAASPTSRPGTAPLRFDPPPGAGDAAPAAPRAGRHGDRGRGRRRCAPTRGQIVYIDPATGRTDGARRRRRRGARGRRRSTRTPTMAARYMQRCVACNHRSSALSTSRSPRSDPGDEAIAAVAAQTLLEAMPREATAATSPPMGGRNLLVFSDNRQDAAFFAPFFERTSREQAIRSAILRAVESRRPRWTSTTWSAPSSASFAGDGCGSTARRRARARDRAERAAAPQGADRRRDHGLRPRAAQPRGLRSDRRRLRADRAARRWPSRPCRSRCRPHAEAFVRYLLKIDPRASRDRPEASSA